MQTSVWAQTAAPLAVGWRGREAGLGWRPRFVSSGDTPFELPSGIACEARLPLQLLLSAVLRPGGVGMCLLRGECRGSDRVVACRCGGGRICEVVLHGRVPLFIFLFIDRCSPAERDVFTNELSRLLLIVRQAGSCLY